MTAQRAIRATRWHAANNERLRAPLANRLRSGRTELLAQDLLPGTRTEQHRDPGGPHGTRAGKRMRKAKGTATADDAAIR